MVHLSSRKLLFHPLDEGRIAILEKHGSVLLEDRLKCRLVHLAKGAGECGVRPHTTGVHGGGGGWLLCSVVIVVGGGGRSCNHGTRIGLGEFILMHQGECGGGSRSTTSTDSTANRHDIFGFTTKDNTTTTTISTTSSATIVVVVAGGGCRRRRLHGLIQVSRHTSGRRFGQLGKSQGLLPRVFQAMQQEQLFPTRHGQCRNNVGRDGETSLKASLRPRHVVVVIVVVLVLLQMHETAQIKVPQDRHHPAAPCGAGPRIVQQQRWNHRSTVVVVVRRQKDLQQVRLQRRQSSSRGKQGSAVVAAVVVVVVVGPQALQRGQHFFQK
mmetsp:Transcript_6408/g.18038  ORF Transcript_6408/g.18038 Transcript_6408/m.18038 type:complete len:325 (-) Transcript_6408:1763-2737(-)